MRLLIAPREISRLTAPLIIALNVLDPWASHAAPDQYDGFASAPGTALHGAGGGVGFDGGWYGSTNYTVAAGSLGVPGLLTEGGHVVTGPEAGRISRAFQAFGNDGTTSYLSFYLRPDGDLVGRLGVELQGHNATLFVGKPSNDHYRNYGLQKADGVGQVSALLEAVKGVGVFVVVKCESLPGNDRVTLYLNPVPGEPEPASGTVKDDVDWGVFLLVSLHATSAASFDEVRLGETYEQVTSVTCAPEFDGQPADTTAVLGRPFTLRVRPGGTRPTSMRWHKDGNPLVNGGTIAGTETMALTIDPVTATDAGGYQLRTMGTCLVTDSRIAAVSVVPLLITNQPRSHYTAIGSNAVLSVGVESATPVIYQWQFENSNLTGETNAVLVRNSIGLSGTGNYRVICQNAIATVTSEPARIEVMANSFLGQPETNPANGHLYFVLPNSDWTNAENASVRLGGHLVTINDAAENTYVCERFRDFAGGLRHLWLGFVDGDIEHNSYFTNHRMNEFGWTSGQPVTYANWWRTDPNNLIIEPYLGGEFVVWLATFATTWGDIAYNNTNMFGGSPVFTHGLAEVEITPPVPPLPSTVGAVRGATVVLNGRSGGLLPQSFQWFLNGQPLAGQTSEILRIENSQVSDSGTYSVAVSNRLGVVSGTVAVVTVTILPPTSLEYLLADFEGGKPSQLSGGTRVDSQGFSARGFGRHLLVSQGDTNAGNAVTLTLTGLPAHTSVDLDFLLAIINSWDGWAPAPGGHDLFNVEVDGVSVYRYHFSNLWLGNMINPPPGTAIVFQTNNVGFAATGGGAADWADSAYRVGLRALPHSASTLTIRWYADGNGWTGGANPTDEFWGIDNLRVGLNNVTQSAPVISLQPSSKTVPIGGVATFTAAAAGWPTPNYAWYREGSTTPLGVGGSLSFGPVSGAEAGDYYVVASNAFGSVTSAVASLTLSDNQPPAPATPLPDHSVLAGAPFNFSVPAGTFTDPDPGQTLTFSASGLPAGVTFNPTTRAFGGVPLAGVHVIAVTATDNGTPALSSIDTFLLTVSSGGLAHFEGFDYPAGALAGRNGGNGFIGSWYGGTYSSTGGSLALPGTPSVGGRGFSSATSGNVARRPLNPAFFGDGTTRYFSVRLRSDGPPTGWFGVSLFGNAGRGLFVGKPGGTTTTNYVIENAGGGQQVIAPHTAVNGSNVFLVVRCEFFSGNDRLTLFVNPTPGMPEPIEGIVKYNADFGVLTNLELTGSSPYSVDEIRIGTSFSEVAPAVCPPIFVTQPANPPAVLGLPLTLTARAAGQGPFEHQWRKDGVPLLDYGPFTGTRTDTLVIPSPTAEVNGGYDLLVTSPCGTITSQTATVSVDRLAFLTQPVSQAIKPGSNAVFSVSVLSASPVSYQWQFNGVNIENATSPTLTVLSAQVAQRGNYRCVAHNSLGDFTSANAYLEVIVAPTFVEHPQSLTVAVGADASFSAAVTNTASVPITFTLRKGSTSLANPPPQTLMSTGCSFTLMNVQLSDAGSYRIVATNIAGQLLGSSAATLTVMEPPAITSQPQSLTVAGGASATFTVVATGGAPLTYQWRRNGASLTDATNSTLTIATVAAGDAGDYTVVVSNPVGAVTSQAAVLSLEPVVDPLHLAPAVTNAVTGGTVAFIASGGTPPYTFTLAANVSGGSLTPAGSYTAGNTPGIDTVQVTDSAGSNATATITVSGCTTLIGMVAWWRGENNALDSFDSHDGALMNGAGFAAGRPGQALTLDGVNDFVEVPASAGLSVTGAITVAAWVNPASASASGAVVAKYNSALDRASWGLQLVSGGVEFYVNGSGVLEGAKWADTAPGLLPAGTWSHVAGTFDTENQQLRVFINGQEIPATLGHDAVIPAIVDNEEPVRIGSYVNSSGDLAGFLGALVDEVMLYRRALSPTEVFAVSQGCVTAPPLRVVPDATNTASGGLVAFNIRGGTPPYTFTLVTNSSGGSIAAGGLYTAGAGCGTDTVLVTDATGSNALAGVIVSDAMPPTVTCPADITVEAGSPAGAIVDFTVSASDACTPHPILIVSPPSGSEFPPGTNVVTCSAVDEAGNTGTCTFKIIVRDTTPPAIDCPAIASVETVNPAGTAVSFSVTASDAVDSHVAVIVTPASGTVFPPGTTTVNCLATDDAGNTRSCSFTVTVTVVPTTFAVSGRVALGDNTPVAGVAVSLTGGSVNTSAVTDAGGNYLFNSVSPGSYTVTAAHPNFAITPVSASVTVAAANVTRDFAAVRTAITISGRVTNCISGAGVAGARVYATRTRMSAVTDGDGYYSLPSVPVQPEIPVFPSVSDGITQPGSVLLIAPQSDATAHFCVRQRLTVTGLVRDADGLGLDNCTVAVSGDVSTTLSTRAGRFTLRALQGQNLTFTVTTDTHLFMPDTQSFDNLIADVSVAFTGVARPELAFPGRLAYGRLERRTWGQYANQFRSHTMLIADSGRTEPSSWTHIFGSPGFTRSPVYSIGHAWSRDGSTLFLRRGSRRLIHREGLGTIELANLDSLISRPYGASPSPDGSRLACVDSAGALWIATSDGSSAVLRVTSGVGGLASWSPDGTELVYPSGAAIVRIKVDQQPGDPPPSIVLSPYAPLHMVAWSPDGRRFACTPTEPWPSFVMGTNGGAPILEVPGARAEVWSPDGQRLAYTKLVGWRLRLFTIRVDGTGLRELPWNAMPSDGSGLMPLCWGPYYSHRTAIGTDQSVGSPNGVTVQFAGVTEEGGTTIRQIPAESTTLPPGYFSFGGASAVQVETTARFSGPITVCFRVGDSTTEATFNRLRIFHGEGGVLVDRTVLPPDSPAPNYATRSICARVTSLSPFLLGERIDATLPQITGMVVDTNGNPIVDAYVALEGDSQAEVRTDLGGRFVLPNLAGTGNYVAGVTLSGYEFTPNGMDLPVLGTGADMLFVGSVAPPPPMPSLTIAADAHFGGQPTLTWTGFPGQFILEATDSLSPANWSIAPELQLPTGLGVAVPLAPARAERYYRLKR